MFRPSGACFFPTPYPRLAPRAAFFRRFAAKISGWTPPQLLKASSRAVSEALSHGRDSYRSAGSAAPTQNQKKLGGSSQDGLGAVGAAAGVDGNLAEAFGAFLGGGIGGLLAAIHAGDESIYGSDHEEINRRGNQEK